MPSTSQRTIGLILADRIGRELEPLTDELPVALLPIAGKPVLLFAIEELASAGLRELILIESAHDRQTEITSLGDGSRWGVYLRHVSGRGEERPSRVWYWLDLSPFDRVLVLRGDLLRAPMAANFLDRVADQAGIHHYCAAADPRGGMLLLHRDGPEPDALLDGLRWDQSATAERSAHASDPRPAAYLNLLDDLTAFYRANRDLIAGRVPGLHAPGEPVALGLGTGTGARIHPSCLRQGVAYVGSHSHVYRGAELLGEVVIGENVIIDRHATIRDSVILPYTYVGELLEVDNAIVAGNRLIRMDTGARLCLSEVFLLSDIRPFLARSQVSVRDRLLGLLLLVISLPLWPIAAVASARRWPPIGSRELVGNRARSRRGCGHPQGFRARYWRTRLPVLRHLPLLLALVQGDLRLIGVSPLTPDESSGRREQWEKVRDQSPVGLLGPTQLDLPADAPLEERLLSDAFLARAPEPGGDLRILLRALGRLLSPAAWTSTRSLGSRD